MILENTEINKSHKKITRICDECGKKETSTSLIVYRGRVKRGEDIDLCGSCSCSKKYKKYKTGAEHQSFKHGLKAGYKRVTWKDGRRGPEHRFIYEEYIGRGLKAKEVIHHIDFNKINNSLDNLCLFKNQSEHLSCHRRLEVCGFKLLNHRIWFNNNEYVLDECKYENSYRKIDLTKYGHQIGTKFPVYYYIDEDGNEKKIRCHTAVGQEILGRRLYRDEVVHHIDGNNLNNVIDNLIVVTRKKHIDMHYSLQKCCSLLLVDRIISFDLDNKKYYIAK